MGITFAISKYLTGNNLDQQGALTLMGWIYPTSFSSPNTIVGAGASPGLPVQYRLIVDTVGKVQATWASGTSGGNEKTRISTATVCSLNNLYHIAATRYGTTPFEWLQLFVNGVAVASATANTGSPTMPTVQTFAIGRNGGYDGWYFKGRLFDVRMYSAVLSNSEIAAIYAEAGRDNITHNLVGRWPMLEGQSGATASGANTVLDVSGNGKHQTPTGSPTYVDTPMKIFRGY